MKYENGQLSSEKGFDILRTKKRLQEDVVEIYVDYVVKSLVFEEDGKYYSLQYVFEEGQGVSPTDFFIRQVRPVEKTIIVYENVKD